MRLKNLKLSHKFALLLALGVAAFAGVLGVGQATFSTVKVGGPLYARIIAGKDLTADVLPPPLYVVESYLLAFEMAGIERQSDLDACVKRLDTLRSDYEARHAHWTTDLPEGELKTALLRESAEPARAFFDALQTRMVPLLRQGKRDEALALARTDLKARYEAHRSAIDRVVALSNRYAADAEAQAGTTVTARVWQLLAVAGVSLGLTCAFCILLARSISGPASRMARMLRDAAESNDLTARLDIDRHDEIGQLAASTNTLLDRMQRLVGDVSNVANEVAGAATQIAASAEEMSASVAEVARQTAQASDAANRSGELARGGGQSVDQTLEGMQRIHQAVESGARSVNGLGSRAEQIGKVIAVINEIADQTNLLALNAAIEAARAGEHGRGFAVVADEVRKLAERTTRATEEVGSSIEGIQTDTRDACALMNRGTAEVGSGVELAERAGSSLREIVASASNVAGMISSISAASQQAGAGASESAAAAAHLAAKASDLLALVDFKLK